MFKLFSKFFFYVAFISFPKSFRIISSGIRSCSCFCFWSNYFHFPFPVVLIFKMDSVLARLFLEYSYANKVLSYICDDDTNTVTGLAYVEGIAESIDPLPIPFPTDMEPTSLYGWFKQIVIDWLDDILWSPSQDIPEHHFQRLFCCYAISCRRP